MQGPVFDKMNNVLRFFSGKSWYSDSEWPTAQLPFPQIMCARLKLGHWKHVDGDGDGGGHHEWIWHNKYTSRAPP